jgi:TusA-related sulfurtransferase
MTGATAILTVADVEQEALGSTSVPGEEGLVTQRAIEEAQARVAAFLRRPVMIHKATEGAGNWHRDETGDKRWRYRGRSWPVVQVETSGYDARFDDRHLVASTPESDQVTYFAGWKRRDRSLSDLPTGSGEALEGLTTEPPTVPGDIRRVALKLTLHELIQTEEGIGIQTLSQATGGGVATVNGPDPQAPRRLLKSISSYRTSPF